MNLPDGRLPDIRDNRQKMAGSRHAGPRHQKILIMFVFLDYKNLVRRTRGVKPPTSQHSPVIL